ncbi:MAG: PAS domain S-box protein, partial [Candidatus Thorarchaeota archaeon]
MSRVLLVDDEKDLLDVTQQFLEKELPKFNFYAVETAYEAIEALKENDFDIIVSDYQMPGMDGLELLEWLRKQDNLTPFVMFTGRGREEVAIKALNLGADYYLRKSQDLESLYKELSHIIESVVEHRRTAEALKRSEREKALILSSTPDNITFQNRELAIIWANEAAAISADSRPKELVGRFCFEIWNQRSAPCPDCPVLQAVRTGEPQQGEQTTPDKRVWSIRGYPVRDEAGEIIGAVEVTREITAQKRAEGALLESEANYRSLVAHSLQGILVFQDGTIKFANPVIEEISGYSLEELFQFAPSDLQNLIHPDYRAMFQDYVASLLKGEIGPKRHEYQICRKDGGFRWVEAFSIPISYQDKPAVQASILDITERKQTERALQQAYEKREELEHIINRSPAVVFLWQNAEGWPVEFVSDNVAQFGYTPRDFYSGEVLFADIIHPQDLNRIANEVEKYSQDGRLEFVQEYRIIAKTGEIYWVDDRTWIRRGPDGTITHYQGIILDISERIRTEKTLKRQKEELSEFAHA